MKQPPPAGRTAGLLFLGLFALYLSMSPLTVGGRGYVPEEVDSGMRMLESFNAWVKGRPVPPLIVTRHGLIPILFDLPFIKLGKMIVSPDFMMSMSPIFFTSALLTILYLWLRKITSPGMSLLVTLAGAFATLLWPYAYIGLETKQSFFVMLAGYFGIADGKSRSWTRLMLFGAAGGLALTMKSTGLVLWPALAYLVYAQFGAEWRNRWKQAVSVMAVMGGVWAAGELGSRLYWAPRGGGYSHLSGWLIDSPLQFFGNMIGVFGSPTKGLLVCAPVLLISLFVIPRALRVNREVTLFALFVTGSTLALVSMLIVSADEVWGMRYMHVTVAPLLLCIGVAWERFEWRRIAVFVPLVVLGISISFLGAFYYYGSRAAALYDGGHNTMQWLFGDPSWGEVAFNSKAFRVWLKGCPSTPWTALHIWVWEPPPGALPWKPVDLQKYCQPQSLLIREWGNPLDGVLLSLFRMCEISLAVGTVALFGGIWTTVSSSALQPRRSLGLPDVQKTVDP
jgi:hypothetical protein